MKKLIAAYPTYLFLLPMFFVLHHNNELFGFIPVSQSLLALLYCYVGLAICLGIFFLLNRSILLSALVTFLFGLFILFFGSVLDGLKGALDHTWITKYIVLVPMMIVIIFVLSWLFKQKPALLKKVQTYLNILFILFLLLEIFNAGSNALSLSRHKNLIYPEKFISANYTAAKTDSTKPDIFFIVVDAYTSNLALQQLWQFNNSAFLDWLKSENFYVADSSKANYNFTPFSISSTLNMNYLSKDVGTRGNIPPIVLRGVRSMSDNETISILKKEGYNLKYFIPFDSEIEDIKLYHEFNDFSNKELYNQTFPVRFEHDVLWNFVSGKWNPGWIKRKSLQELPSYQNFVLRANAVAKTIERLKESCDSNVNRKPQFVYAHFMITHQPHLFDSLGNLRQGKDLLDQSNVFATYIQQVKFANKTLRDLVDYIKSHNRQKTIIIIEGDHGFRDLPPSQLSYQFPNLNAIYFPDHDYRMFYPQMSPVNTFRIVFNHYFGQNLPLLKDSTVIVKF